MQYNSDNDATGVTMPGGNHDSVQEQPADCRRPFVMESEGTMFLNRYRVIKELGHGTMGIVYHCCDEKAVNTEVAVKKLPSGLACDQYAVEDLRRIFKIVTPSSVMILFFLQ